MLPAYVANMTPVFFSNVKMGRVLDSPVDLRRSFLGKRIFGDNKTVKGFLFGTLFGVLTCLVQFCLFKYGFVKELNLIGYTFYNSVLIGFLLGFGALLGDSIKSFFKRQLSIKPGRPFPVFDQIDYVLGSLLLVLTSVNLSWQIIVIILLISPLLPIIANIIAYSLKLKKVWW